MQRRMLAALTGTALMMAAMPAMPAETAWKSYISKDLGFSFMAPGQIKTEVGTFRGADAGPRQTIVFRATENNIEYKVTVMTLIQAQAEGASILGEREYMFQDKKKTVSDTFSRVETGKDTVYGRKIVVDLPENKGRATGAFYFNKGKLITLEATVAPTGNKASPDIARFVDSIGFTRAVMGAVELQTPKFE